MFTPGRADFTHCATSSGAPILKRSGTAAFNGNTHQAFFVFKMAMPAMVLEVKFHTKQHRAFNVHMNVLKNESVPRRRE